MPPLSPALSPLSLPLNQRFFLTVFVEFLARYSLASMKAARYPATLPMRVCGATPLPLPYTRLGFSPQAIFMPHGAPGNFIAW